ncbi:putative formate transporter [Fulvia fulva]|nr:putative formate transporter [Fulvia fulva]KAK4625196.1 putative formate transporter [Fulvia fulva]WPV15649.1 putative formate transporter [Fulvia fulva]
MPPQHPTNIITNAYTPKETVELCGRAGSTKANMRLDKVFMLSVMAGMFLSFACAALLSTNTAPWFTTNAPGLIRTIGALIFPFGLTMVIVTGTDLCTGSFMLTTIAALQRRISVVKMLQHWFITFWGNLAGSLFIVGLITGYGEIFNAPAYTQTVFTFNASKVVTPTWHAIFLGGIGANWLVCMACFLSMMAREYFSKVMAIWWLTFAFVYLGLDHVVANMFFVPTANFHGDPAISTTFYIWKSLIPALVGNIVSGALFVGVFFWYLWLTGEGPVATDGVYFPADKAIMGIDTGSPDRHDCELERKSGGETPEKMV